MANSKAISDEQIIAALLSSGTIRGAAQAVGISERAIYDRMNTHAFQAVYMAAKSDLIREAVFSINSKLTAAIDTIAEIMEDPEQAASSRLHAAGLIINNAAKFSARLQREEKDAQTESESFDIGFNLDI